MLQPQHAIEISDDDDDDVPEIEESEWKKKLFASLNAIQAEPKLVSFRSYQEFVNPGLKIGGQQRIPLPLTDHYADIIKELSHSVQGTGNKAQNVWELDRAQFDLINPAWPLCLDRIAQEITKELDIANALLSPKKLTLQGPGPVAEQDQSLEQSDHIVGYISVCLPSEHQGGDIGVSLGGRRKTVSTAASSALDLSAIGWISPAHSLATELVSGYRLSISYIVHRFNDGQSTVPSSYIGSGRVEEVLQMWQRRHFGTKKILYKLDDKKGTGVLSLREARERDKAVCEALSMACSEAGLYMLFAEITHEVTNNLTCKTVESSINGLFTPEGQYLAENKELDAENEVLGFDVDRKWDLEPASDDDEGMSNGYLMEEHDMTRRWHDHAVLLIPKEGLLDLVRPDGRQNTSRRPGQPQDQESHHPGVAPVVAMVVDDLEKNPAGTITVAENIIDKLCDTGNDKQVLCTCINPIVNWCLRSGYMPLYTTAFRKTPITVVHVLAEYLASKYEGAEDSIDWKEWLDDITKKPIGQLGILYRDFSRTILAVSPPVWKSFDEWSETIMDEKLNTELDWGYKDLEMILDLMRLRCDSTQWIVNRLLPRIASGRHSESHSALLIQLLFHIYQFRNEPQFKHAKEMYKSIINHSDGELNFSPLRLEPAEEGWLVETPRHDLICGPFIRLITECHAMGAFVEASKVIEETFSLFVAEKARWILVKDPFGVIFCLITPLIRLAADGLWRKIPALLDTLELLVRKIIRLDLSRQSQAGGGLVFRERGCGFCEDCAELDRFLTSPRDTVWEFNAPKTRRLHIEHAIGVEKSLQALRILDQTTGTCEKLRVTKTAAQAEPDLRSWVFNYNGLERVLQPLRGDFMRKTLGEQRYREIILLAGHWFEDFSSRILRDTAKGLGMFELRADPHKLLLYEPGSFFQARSDSEREQGTIGTLIVYLPLQHEGGDICLSFKSQKRRLSTAENSEFDLTVMSWYSDVAHEVERLTSGYRLVLTYKLFATGEDKLSASTFFQQTKALKSMLAKFRTDFTDEKLLYPLDHLYTKPGRCLRDLKGRGRSVGRYLNENCSEAGFYFMLGQTTHFQVDCDSCDEYQDQTTLRTLYNLNGDKLSSDLVLDLEEFLDYDIRGLAPDSEDDGGMQSPLDGGVPDLISKCALELENTRIFRKCLRKNFRPYGEGIGRGLVDHLRKHFDGKEQAINWNFWFQELIRDTISADDLCSVCAVFKSSATHPLLVESFQVWADPIYEEKIQSQASWKKENALFVLNTLKKRIQDEEWLLQIAGQEALRILERKCNTFNENKELWLRVENNAICDKFLEPLFKVLESNEAPTISVGRISTWKPRCERYSIVQSVPGQTNWQDGLTKTPPVGPGPKQSAKTSNGLMLSLRILNSKNGNAQWIARN
ncbi:hypothetical protein H9Q71_006567 [Fusarium xylarioides]|nr:hypothetical protein H9Q71_006567 [Fusarium xylarioides]